MNIKPTPVTATWNLSAALPPEQDAKYQWNRNICIIGIVAKDIDECIRKFKEAYPDFIEITNIHKSTSITIP